MDNFRVENKQNVIYGGEVTSFSLYEYDGWGSYIFVGAYTADGFDASDSKCIAAYNNQRNEL